MSSLFFKVLLHQYIVFIYEAPCSSGVLNGPAQVDYCTILLLFFD